MNQATTHLADLLGRRILVLDGAMGTMIQAAELAERDFHKVGVTPEERALHGNNELLSLTRPDVIAGIHHAYLDAGADIIETNTFNANAISQADYGTASLVYRLNRESAALAREAADEFTRRNPQKPRFVAGSVGPTNKTCSISPDITDPGYRNVTFDPMLKAYDEQIRGLLDGGCDLILIETVFDTLNAKAAIQAVKMHEEAHGVSIPLWVSGTITDAAGRLLCGQTVEAFWVSICHAKPLIVGLNCALGPDQLTGHVRDLSSLAGCHVAVHPNAGLPDALGDYALSPEQMASSLCGLARQSQVNVVGGCCGTTPDHVQVLCNAVAGLPPRGLPTPAHSTHLSGLEPLTINAESLFVNIGEQTNIAGSRKFARHIREGDYGGAVEIARRQVRQGAQIIDINVDDALLDGPEVMTTFLNHLASEPEVSRVPFMIDSSDWPTLEAGLKCLQGRGIVNSISLKEGEEEFLRVAARIQEFGAAAVVMAIDEKGQAVTAARKIEICERAFRLLVNRASFTPEDIILDPNVLTIGTGVKEHNDYAVAFLEACRFIKANLPGARVSGGISNLSFAFRGRDSIREALHSVFLYHAIQAGLDLGLVNAGRIPHYDELDAPVRLAAEDLILNRRPDATDRILQLAVPDKPASDATSEETWRNESVEERLRYAIIHGRTDRIEHDAVEAYHKLGTALDVIDGPLFEGMSVVGERFGAGKMFLPQVIKSARSMKKAVAAIEPYMERTTESLGNNARGTIVLATVKGDVHDIGKNIVGIVLGCNGYRVVDLGVMVPIEQLLDRAIEENADMIGVSGLITPSLEVMAQIAREMQRRDLDIPLLIGGATTSPTHTAVKIAPEYSGTVVHVSDAPKAVEVAGVLSDKERRAEYGRQVRTANNLKREVFDRRQAEREILPLEQARARFHQIDWANYQPVPPATEAPTLVRRYSIRELTDYIDWAPFFRAFELPGRYPQNLSHPVRGSQARQLLAEAQGLLEKFAHEDTLEPRAVMNVFPANSDGDDIVIFADAKRQQVRWRLPMLRQQRKRKRSEQPHACLADFVAPIASGVADYVGAFAVTAGLGLDRVLSQFRAEHDEYNAILAQALADRLAEALAERLHQLVRREFWGYSAEEQSGPAECLAGDYVGIRPAIGYPACPMHTDKTTLFEMLDVQRAIGIELTEHCMMRPAASVCGWYFAHPESHYLSVGRIGRDQVNDYAARLEIPVTEAERWLSTHLAYAPETKSEMDSTEAIVAREGTLP